MEIEIKKEEVEEFSENFVVPIQEKEVIRNFELNGGDQEFKIYMEDEEFNKDFDEHSKEVSHFLIEIDSEEIVVKRDVKKDRLEECENVKNHLNKEFQFVGVLASDGIASLAKIENNDEDNSSHEEEMNFPAVGDPNELKDPLELESCIKTEIDSEDFEFLSCDVFCKDEQSNEQSQSVVKSRGRKSRKGISDRLKKRCELAAVIRSEMDAIIYFQDRGLLHNRRKCYNGHDMTLHLKNSPYWRCARKECRLVMDIRKDTWFFRTKIDFATVIFFIYWWSNRYASVEFCPKELNMCRVRVFDWCQLMRNVCVASVLENPSRIGGPGLTVEIYLCMFQKSNTVKRLHPTKWIFGGYCEETKESFMFIVEDCNAATLKPIIEKYIIPGSIVLSDDQEAFSEINNMPQYNHENVILRHSFNLGNPNIVANAKDKAVVSTDDSLEQRINLRRFSFRNTFGSHLAEFMWRQRNVNKDLFQTILRDIVEYMPPR